MESHQTQTTVDHGTPAAPLVSIIILNYKTRGLLKYCLRGFLRMRFPFPFEVIVVDNASHDGTPEFVQKEFPQVRCIVLPKNRGFAFGNNEGMRAARGKFFLIANPDIVVRPDAVEELLRFVEERPTAALVGPKLTNPDGSIQDSCYRFPSPLIPLYRRTFIGNLPFAKRALAHYLMHDFDHNSPRSVDWLLGACLLVRREAVERVGMMDERFFLYFEDVDWCRRFRNAGYDVWYNPRASMVHFHQRLSAETRGLKSLFSLITRVHIASGIKYFWKWRQT